MGESGKTHLRTVMGSKMFAKKMHRLVKKIQDKPVDSMDPMELLSEMARKKGENLSFPIEVETENQWSSLLKREGLVVVDVYSGWSGPCTSMFSILRKLKLDTNDDRLMLAAANADNIAQLAPFRNQSEPCWLFIGGGKPVNVLRGSNAPKLVRMIKSEFQHELDCIDGKEKRNLISIKFEACRREKSVNDAIALNELIAREEEEKKAKLEPAKSPTPEVVEENENEEDENKEISSEIAIEEGSQENEEENENDEKPPEATNELDEAEQERRILMEESNIRLKRALRPFTVIAIQSYLLETGAVTEIKDHLAEDFSLVRERYINLGTEDARKLFSIPEAIPDPNPPMSALGNHSDTEDNLSEAQEGESIAENEENASRPESTAQTPVPAHDDETGKSGHEDGDTVNETDGNENDDEEKVKRVKTPVIRMIPVPVPEVLIGDTLILLLECTRVTTTPEKRYDGIYDDPSEGDYFDADYYMCKRTGPENYEEAIETQPESLHSLYGKEKYVAGVWCPRTYEDKRFVMLNYFPQFVTEMLMMPIPDPPKYHIFVYSALFSSEILEHPQYLKEMGDVIAQRRTRIKIDVAEKMLLASQRQGDSLRALKWALTGQEVLVVCGNGENNKLIQLLDCFDPIFSTKLELEAAFFTAKMFPDVEVLIDENPFPPEPEAAPFNLASFVEKIAEDSRNSHKQNDDKENNNSQS